MTVDLPPPSDDVGPAPGDDDMAEPVEDVREAPGNEGMCEIELDVSNDCTECGRQACCDPWLLCQGTFACHCWATCVFEEGNSPGLCPIACGPRPAHFDALDLCVRESCESC